MKTIEQAFRNGGTNLIDHEMVNKFKLRHRRDVKEYINKLSRRKEYMQEKGVPRAVFWDLKIQNKIWNQLERGIECASYFAL